MYEIACIISMQILRGCYPPGTLGHAEECALAPMTLSFDTSLFPPSLHVLFDVATSLCLIQKLSNKELILNPLGAAGHDIAQNWSNG